MGGQKHFRGSRYRTETLTLPIYFGSRVTVKETGAEIIKLATLIIMAPLIA